MRKLILDPTCGSRMFWFNPENPLTVFGDIREEGHILCDGRPLLITPDVLLDFKNLPFASNSFKLVVFDPPHLKHAGKNSWSGRKYGLLGENWKEDISKGFTECFRVLETHGTLIFKWSEIQIPTSDILKLTNQTPLFGHKSGKRSNTHWLCFMK